MDPTGVVAAGHIETATAAHHILQSGGNAYDAVVAAFFTACMAEPVLTSLGGGGFLLACPASGSPVVYDFFVQTPCQRPPGAGEDFYPIWADFGTARQEFHIGLGSVATPGSVRGMFQIQRELGTLTMSRLIEPAVALARRGVEVDPFQAYLFSVVKPIYLATEAARALFADPNQPDQILGCGQRLYQSEQADCLEALAREGESLFYEGELADRLIQLCETGGGWLRREDLRDYAVVKRIPLSCRYRQAEILTNPLPASGGMLIALALDLLQQLPVGELPLPEYLPLLASVLELTTQARLETEQDPCLDLSHCLNPSFVSAYRQAIRGRAQSRRGTTHISVMDHWGNLASLTASNGEGCGQVIPGTGIMLNNMLGEEDLNPQGWGGWKPNTRMTSMMAPTVVQWPQGRRLALGSGGSNRLRSAIVQVLVQVIDFGLPLSEAIAAPRIHLEGSQLSVEGGFPAEALPEVLRAYPQVTHWPDLNLFFGGVHAVQRQGNTWEGMGDPRRNGAALISRPTP